MIKLKKINKYFNKGRSNENHVIKNVSLEFPDTGLVVILGASGSGKTTLLNVISGMDSFNNGTIQIEGKSIAKYDSKRWDEVRNDYIGYIFQNYNLLRDLSVQDNIELVLRISGLHNQEEINRRVNYLLEAVGMDNYNNRRADQLSGGQQQRVAFARALVKNPRVIIADEPTGNLDSKTTIEIMNIIKQISKNKLVIMVTHEQELAEFYADRIIELSNGNIISDEKNKYTGDLSIIQEQIIFLKDLTRTNLVNDDVDMLIYSDEEGKKLNKVGVQVIKRNDTLYVKADSSSYKRIKYLDNDTDIELVDSHAVGEQIVEDSFNLESNMTEIKTDKKRGVITLKDSFKYAIRKMSNINNGGKMLYLVLALVGAVLSVSVGLIGHIYNIDETEFVDMSRNYITIKTLNINYEETKAFEEFDFIREVSMIDEYINFQIETELYYQIRGSVEIEAHPSNIELLDRDSIIYGVHPEETFGIVIDKIIADQLIADYANRGVDSYADVFDCSFKMQASGFDFDVNDETILNFPIVGISNDNSPTVWMAKELIYSFTLPSLIDYSILGDALVISSGTMPVFAKDVLINVESPLIREVGVPSNVGIESGRFQVVGTYTYLKNNKSYDSSLLYLSELEHMEIQYFQKNKYAFSHFEFLAFVDDPEYAISELAKLGIVAESDYLSDYERHLDFQFEQNAAFYIFSIVGIVASSVSIYFIMRSSLISRIYEISVYRALGATKNNVRKMFFVEVVITTTISSLLGYVLMILLLIQAQAQVSGHVEIVRYPLDFTLYGILAMFAVNIFFGLLPINILVRKTPANILAKYDL